MFRHIVNGFIGVSAITTTIETQDLCDDSCIIANRTLGIPKETRGFFPEFDFSINGNMLEDIGFDWHYSVTAKMGPVMVWNGTGVACGFTKVGDDVAFYLQFDLPRCNATAGAIEVNGHARLHLPAPPLVGIDLQLDIWNGRDESAFRTMVKLRHSSPSPPPIAAAKAILPETMFPGFQNMVQHFPRTNITAFDCCDSTCLMKDVQLNFPQHMPRFSNAFHFNVTGNLASDVGEARFGFHATMHVLGVAPLTVLVGNGSACGYTSTGDHVEFKLETGFAECPVPAGKYFLPGRARFTLPLDVLGKLELRVDVADAVGRKLACAHATVRFGLQEESLLEKLI